MTPNSTHPLALDERQRAMLSAMGVRVWPAAGSAVHDTQAAQTASPAAHPVAPGASKRVAIQPPGHEALQSAPEAPAQATAAADLDWGQLKAAVQACTSCGLCQQRRQTVFGAGSPSASPDAAPKVKWLIVGEAPGEQEDAQGLPFVGPAGQLLDQMLKAVGLSRSSNDGGGVYIVNTLKCRPPGNRNPQPQELAQCAPWLQRQIELLQPTLILAMGRFAAQSLLQEQADIEHAPLGRLRGKVHRAHGHPVVVSYHPAYLLRSPAEKAKAWEDLVLAKQFANL
jgi:uracil-DNA glycosylase family 4